MNDKALLFLLIVVVVIFGSMGTDVQAGDRFLDSKIDVSTLYENSIVMGNKDAKYKFTLFTSGKGCPPCVHLHRIIRKALKTRSDIVFFIKLGSVYFKEEEVFKSIICGENPSALLSDYYDGKTIPISKCETAADDDYKKLESKIKIYMVPTMILPNGLFYYGDFNEDIDLLIAQGERKRAIDDYSF